jgi:hypothetical protein
MLATLFVRLINGPTTLYSTRGKGLSGELKVLEEPFSEAAGNIKLLL